MTLLHHAGETTGKNPLSEHALSHVMSDILDNFAPTDEEEIRIELRIAGYREVEVEQVMNAWTERWKHTLLCSTCGQVATHLWGAMDQSGSVHSMAGNRKLTPSCDGCAEGDGFLAVIKAPLDFGTDLTPPIPDHTVSRLIVILNEFDHAQTATNRPFRTVPLGAELTDPVSRVQRALDWIHNLKEVPFR